MSKRAAARTVLILGAGASADSGAPLMSDFFDKARRLHDDHRLSSWSQDYERVRAARAALQRAQAKASIDLYNLEHVFAALEMTITLGGIRGLTADDAKAARDSLQRLTAAVLQQSIDYEWDGERLRAPSDARFIANLCREHCNSQSESRVSLITFNYDMNLEVALSLAGVPYDYCLSGETPIGMVPVCKLHGSMNWQQTADAGPSPVNLQLEQFQLNLKRYDTQGPVQLTLPWLSTDHEAEEVPALPFIVPPIDAKTTHHRHIGGVWKCAASLLASASNIVIAGYSIPPSDTFFRHFFALATIGDDDISTLMLCDPDPEPADRLRNYLSRSLETRLDVRTARFRNCRSAISQLLA